MKRAILLGALLLAGCGSSEDTSTASAETYRLIHAVGNVENESARGLSKAECESRKADLKQVAAAMGTYDEASGHGSITCLPESML